MRCCSAHSSAAVLNLKARYWRPELQLCRVLRLLLVRLLLVVHAKYPLLPTGLHYCLMVLEPLDLLYRAL